MKIAIVLPAHNEAKHIDSVLRSIPKTVSGHIVDVIVVDDGSRDETSALAGNVPGTTVLRHRINLGKGAAAKTGCDAACALGADVIVLMDADGQHRVEELESIIAPFHPGEKTTDLVLGVRQRNTKMPAMMRFGNGVMNFFARNMFNITASDTQSGYRAFRTSAYPKLRWAASNYAMEMEMLILAASHNIETKEVLIETVYHDNHKGTTVLDGVRILQTLIKWKVLWSRESKSLESYLP